MGFGGRDECGYGVQLRMTERLRLSITKLRMELWGDIQLRITGGIVVRCSITTKCDHQEHLGFRSDSEEPRRGEEVRIALTNQLRYYVFVV